MQTNNLIIDATNLEFRVFFVTRGLKNGRSESYNYCTDEESINYTFKFLYSFKKIFERFQPNEVYASWDRRITKDAVNFRRQILGDQYKAGRNPPDDIQDLYRQEVLLIEMLEALGVKNIFPNKLESDDVCAWLTHTLPGNNVVCSADQDFLQLVNNHTSVFNFKDLITSGNFEAKKGIDPVLFKLYKAIKGDPSDNIEGVKGYGEKRSLKLAKGWENWKLDDDTKKLIGRNLKLIDLDYGYKNQPGEQESYEQQFSYLKSHRGDTERFEELSKNQRFTTIINNIDQWKHIINRNSLVELINQLP